MTSKPLGFPQYAADTKADQDASRREVTAINSLLLGASPTRTIPATELVPGMVIVGDSGGRSAVTGEVGMSSTVRGCVRAEVEHGVLYLDAESAVEIVAG